MPYLKPYRHSKSLAFTVSELLIALGILGLIATFTVPKVLHSIDEASYRTAQPWDTVAPRLRNFPEPSRFQF